MTKLTTAAEAEAAAAVTSASKATRRRCNASLFDDATLCAAAAAARLGLALVLSSQLNVRRVRRVALSHSAVVVAAVAVRAAATA